MAIEVSCDITTCHASFEAGIEGDWSVAPRTVSDFALSDSGYGGLLYVYLPEGWSAEWTGPNQVIHCPEHSASQLLGFTAAEDSPPAGSWAPADRPDDSRRYWGD